jgi:hypothetical protein
VWTRTCSQGDRRLLLARPKASPSGWVKPSRHRSPLFHHHRIEPQCLAKQNLPSPLSRHSIALAARSAYSLRACSARFLSRRLTSDCPASPHVVFFLGADRSTAELHPSMVSSLWWFSSPKVMCFRIVLMPWCLSAWSFGLYHLSHVGIVPCHWVHATTGHLVVADPSLPHLWPDQLAHHCRGELLILPVLFVCSPSCFGRGNADRRHARACQATLADVQPPSVPRFRLDALGLLAAPRRSCSCCPLRQNLAGGDDGRSAVAMASSQSRWRGLALLGCPSAVGPVGCGMG